MQKWLLLKISSSQHSKKINYFSHANIFSFIWRDFKSLSFLCITSEIALLESLYLKMNDLVVNYAACKPCWCQLIICNCLLSLFGWVLDLWLAMAAVNIEQLSCSPMALCELWGRFHSLSLQVASPLLCEETCLCMTTKNRFHSSHAIYWKLFVQLLPSKWLACFLLLHF